MSEKTNEGLPLMGAQETFDLRRLPQFQPDAALWARIAGEHARRARRRFWRRGMSVAAAALLAGVAWFSTADRVASGLAGSRASVDAQRESQRLEDQWHRLQEAGRARAPAGLTRLRVIDASLQAAYDGRAAPDELARLWNQRNRVLRGLIERVQDDAAASPASVTQL